MEKAVRRHVHHGYEDRRRWHSASRRSHPVLRRRIGARLAHHKLQVYAACIILAGFFYMVNMGVVQAIWRAIA